MIYFVRCTLTNRIKIGFATDPWKRLTKMQTDSPGALELIGLEPGNTRREAELHRFFGHLRLRGEWYIADHELVDYAKSVAPTPRERRRWGSVWGRSGLTDSAVARATGINQSTIYRIRNGHQEPMLSSARKIAAATGMSLEELFGEAA